MGDIEFTVFQNLANIGLFTIYCGCSNWRSALAGPQSGHRITWRHASPRCLLLVSVLKWKPCHAGMWRSGGLLPRFFNIGAVGEKWLAAPTRPSYFGKDLQLPIEQETGLSPEPVWTLW